MSLLRQRNIVDLRYNDELPGDDCSRLCRNIRFTTSLRNLLTVAFCILAKAKQSFKVFREYSRSVDVETGVVVVMVNVWKPRNKGRRDVAGVPDRFTEKYHLQISWECCVG